MKRQRTCVDNSVIGGCFDEELSAASIKLMEAFVNRQIVTPNYRSDALHMAGATRRILG